MHNIHTLNELYQYFDRLLDEQDDDLLFVSSYLRGFVALAAVAFGDDEQRLSSALAEDIATRLNDARTELAPSDRALVQQFWRQLQPCFSA